jgi:hypothetical protein
VDMMIGSPSAGYAVSARQKKVPMPCNGLGEPARRLLNWLQSVPVLARLVLGSTARPARSSSQFAYASRFGSRDGIDMNSTKTFFSLTVATLIASAQIATAQAPLAEPVLLHQFRAAL